MTAGELRPCWQNCTAAADDGEIAAIDAMEDSLAPLDESTVQIRRLITLFEACYQEADKEAEFIAAAIGAGSYPPPSSERPPRRKRELENAREILSAWCRNPMIRGAKGEVGGVRADDLLGFLGEPNPLKLWQVARVVDRVSHALDPDHPYRNLVLPAGAETEPGAGERHSYDPIFLQQTRELMIHDTVEGRESKVSLAFAIDLLMPCGWDFVGSLVTILKAIGGATCAERPLACCARNIKLSPLYNRLQVISDTLRTFCRDERTTANVDHHILASLGTLTPVKRWLAASLDKTIRLHLTQPFDMDLF